MNSLTSIVSILLAGILTDNIVLTKFLVVCPVLNAYKKASSIFYMSITMTVVMLISTAITYPIYTYLLYPKFTFLQTIIFIFIIIGIVQLIEILLKKFIKQVYNVIGNYLPIITTNCAVLGVTLLNVKTELSFVEALFNALAAGIGFMVAMLLFSGVRSKIEAADVPEFLKGLPITLIAAALVALSFLDFAGIG